MCSISESPDLATVTKNKSRPVVEDLYQCPNCNSQLTQHALWQVKDAHGDEPIAQAPAKERRKLEINWLITPQASMSSPPVDALDDLSLARENRVMDDALLIPSTMTPIPNVAPTHKRVNRSERKNEKEYHPQSFDDMRRVPPSMPLFDPNRHASSKGPIDNQPQRRATIDSSGRGNKRPGRIQQLCKAAPSTGTVDTAPTPMILKHQPRKDVVASSPVFSRQRGPDYDEMDGEVIKMIKQPETRPISQDQLVAEVKAIYAGLVLVEAKCIKVDTKQSQLTNRVESDRTIVAPRLNNEQWQTLIALHRTLLHEHHDFLLASQHPSASPSLRKLASKYAMPARIWRHGTHSFLELLRHRSPPSFEHTLTFIYLAYSMMALLYEIIPAFADTWVKCLGELSRYRMAIEEADLRDGEVWTNVARSWYTKGTDRTPLVGRLHHHLAILARPNYLQQLFYYSKSLIVGTPFLSARDSMSAMFDPLGTQTQQTGDNAAQAVDIAFLNIHSLLLQAINARMHEDVKANHNQMLDTYHCWATRLWSDFLLLPGKTPSSAHKPAKAMLVSGSDPFSKPVTRSSSRGVFCGTLRGASQLAPSSKLAQKRRSDRIRKKSTCKTTSCTKPWESWLVYVIPFLMSFVKASKKVLPLCLLMAFPVAQALDPNESLAVTDSSCSCLAVLGGLTSIGVLIRNSTQPTVHSLVWILALVGLYGSSAEGPGASLAFCLVFPVIYLISILMFINTQLPNGVFNPTNIIIVAFVTMVADFSFQYIQPGLKGFLGFMPFSLNIALSGLMFVSKGLAAPVQFQQLGATGQQQDQQQDQQDPDEQQQQHAPSLRLPFSDNTFYEMMA